MLTERAEGAINRQGPTITTQSIKAFARTARKRMRIEGGGYRRDYLRALAQRVEVDAKEVRIMGSKSVLLRTLVAASSAKTAGFGVPSFVPKWRARKDSNLLGQLARHSIIPAMKCELAHTRSGLRAVFSSPKGLKLVTWGVRG